MRLSLHISVVLDTNDDSDGTLTVRQVRYTVNGVGPADVSPVASAVGDVWTIAESVKDELVLVHAVKEG